MYLLTVIYYLMAGSQIIASSNDEAMAELKKMNKVYADASSISMDIKLNMAYSDDTSPVSNSGSMKRKGDLFYSEMLGRTVLNAKKLNLLVDKKNKYILINDAIKGELEENQYVGVPDSLYTKNNQLKVTEKNGKSYITIKPKNNSMYDQVDVTLDSKKSHLLEFAYTYTSTTDHNLNKVSITYSNIKINSGLTDEDFSESKFIIVSKGTYTPTAAYSGYKIVDKRNTN